MPRPNEAPYDALAEEPRGAGEEDHLSTEPHPVRVRFPPDLFDASWRCPRGIRTLTGCGPVVLEINFASILIRLELCPLFVDHVPNGDSHGLGCPEISSASVSSPWNTRSRLVQFSASLRLAIIFTSRPRARGGRTLGR